MAAKNEYTNVENYINELAGDPLHGNPSSKSNASKRDTLEE